jgi:putative membrane protein
MVTAHTRTTQALEAAIRRAGMTPPPPPGLTDDQSRMIADLRAAHGDQFDKVYVDQQIRAHQDALGLMQGFAQTGQPGPIRDAAAKTAPLVQHHLDMATALQSHGAM